MRNLANFIHTLFCRKQHLQNIEDIKTARSNPAYCLFYFEEIIENSWELKDHELWLVEAESLVKKLEVSSPDEAFDLLNQALSILKNASPLVQKYPKLKDLLIKLINGM